MGLKIVGLLLIAISLLHIATTAAEDLKDKPDQIISFFRHGARGPLNPYNPAWPLESWGGLTSVGVRQQFILGQALWGKYSHILKPNSNFSQVYVLSDDPPRCVQSAVSQLYGMYINQKSLLREDYPLDLAIPPFEDPDIERFSEALPYNAESLLHFIPGIVNIVDSENAFIFQGDGARYCPNSDSWLNENSNDSMIQRGWELFSPTIDNLNRLIGPKMQLKTSDDIYQFGDTLLASLADNRTLAGQINDTQLIQNFTHAFAFFTFHLWVGQKTQLEITTFPLVNEMLQQMRRFQHGENYHGAALYSAHDDNILPLLAAFGVLTQECLLDNFESYLRKEPVQHPNCYYPGFASSVIIELYNKTKVPYVKVLYNNVPVAICQGKEECELEEFFVFANNSVGNLTLTSYFQKCGTTQAKLDDFGIRVLLDPVGSKKQSEVAVEVFESRLPNGSLIPELMPIALAAMTCLCFFLMVKLQMKKGMLQFMDANDSVNMRVKAHAHDQ